MIDLEQLAGRTFDAVLFDMDGTLIDSMAGSLRAWAAWAQEHGVDPAELATGGRTGTSSTWTRPPGPGTGYSSRVRTTR